MGRTGPAYASVRRGEIWTVSGGPDYAGKPRPWVIIQSDHFALEHSVTLCGLTSGAGGPAILRPLIDPHPDNGLDLPSRVMVDKITTVPRVKMGSRIGLLARADMDRVERALLLFLGFGN